ncbi:MAG: hypothetical protein IJB84_00960 [Lachnospiraceae bacterium]|nr:hypothetical protein [Lachnospiraceae bacterium]
MKKILKTIAIIVVVIIVAAVACGDSSESGDEKQIVTSGDNKDTSSTTGTVDETDKVVSDATSTASGDVTIEQQVLLDRDGIVITAVEYVTDSIWGDGIKLLLENNTDKTVMVGCKALIVNNYMISDLFASEIAAGKKANEVMYLSNSQLKAAGIESVGQVEMYFHVSDSESYDTIFDTDCITIQTSAFTTMDTTPNDMGTELYNANGIRIVGKTVDEDSFWGTAILLYCENNSGQNANISVEEMSINGFMMNPLFYTEIYDGKMAIEDITVFSSDLEENGIEAIEEVELKFHIYNAENYDTIADSEPITFSAQ